MGFLWEASKLRLPLSSPTDGTEYTVGSEMVSFGMTAKKSHEVEKFSNFVSTFVLKQSRHIGQV